MSSSRLRPGSYRFLPVIEGEGPTHASPPRRALVAAAGPRSAHGVPETDAPFHGKPTHGEGV